MKLQHYLYNNSWDKKLDNSLDSKNTLVIVFGSSDISLISKPLQDINNTFKQSTIIGASTSQEILMDEIYEDSLVVSVLKFSTTKIKLFTSKIADMNDSSSIGEAISKNLYTQDLKAIFVLSDGLNINGSQLTQGINTKLPSDIAVTGGLAGDGASFKSTWIIIDNKPVSKYVSALGFYGEDIEIGHGFNGGWDKFGIQRKVTKSKYNIVYEVDNKPILDIYKDYLGEKAKELPASGLLFPLELQSDKNTQIKTVRTILGVNEDEKSIVFAGDIPEGSYVTLMKSNHNRLVDGASSAAESVDLKSHTDEPILAIAISCIGRKLVLKQETEDELEATLDNFPQNTLQIGFYSYGEISPSNNGKCDLHNQTMTLTTIWEKDA
jgi:hypothetical protein